MFIEDCSLGSTFIHISDSPHKKPTRSPARHQQLRKKIICLSWTDDDFLFFPMNTEYSLLSFLLPSFWHVIMYAMFSNIVQLTTLLWECIMHVLYSYALKMCILKNVHLIFQSRLGTRLMSYTLFLYTVETGKHIVPDKYCC